MKSIFDFVIEPFGSRYNNSVDVGGKDLIINTEMSNHQFVNRTAIIKSIPLAVKTELKVGDIIIVHHNVFRRMLDVKGREKNSRSYVNENTYIVSEDQIYLYKRDGKWKSLSGYCFVQPMKSDWKYTLNKEKPLVGIVKYGDANIEEGNVVGFSPGSEYEFIVDNTRLYRVMTKFITIKYEYQGNEETYNPSWT